MRPGKTERAAKGLPDATVKPGSSAGSYSGHAAWGSRVLPVTRGYQPEMFSSGFENIQKSRSIIAWTGRPGLIYLKGLGA